MKRKIIAATLGLFLALPVVAQSAEKATDSTLKTFKEKLSYSVGTDIGKSLEQLKDEVDINSVILGLQDSIAGKELLLNPEQMQEVQQQFVMQMQAKQQEKLLEMQQKNREAGDKFLAENKKVEGVVVTESGLQYQITEQGDGALPTADDVVSVHYTGTLIDGTKFDSSFDRGKPADLPLNGIIPGWTEALQLMKVGTKAHLVIPSDLAYGENGAPPVIEPNSVLVFDVELLAIKEVPKEAAPAVEKAEAVEPEKK